MNEMSRKYMKTKPIIIDQMEILLENKQTECLSMKD